MCPLLQEGEATSVPELRPCHSPPQSAALRPRPCSGGPRGSRASPASLPHRLCSSIVSPGAQGGCCWPRPPVGSQSQSAESFERSLSPPGAGRGSSSGPGTVSLGLRSLSSRPQGPGGRVAPASAWKGHLQQPGGETRPRVGHWPGSVPKGTNHARQVGSPCPPPGGQRG